MRKILILGPTGSGKTTSANEIAKLLGVTAIALDDLFWDNQGNNWAKKRDEQARDLLLAQILSRPIWVIEGVYDKWLPDAFDQANVIVLLQMSRAVRWWRIIKRYIKQKTGYCTGKRDNLRSLINLLKWDIQYERDNLVRIKEKLKRADLAIKTRYISTGDDLTTFIRQFSNHDHPAA